MSAVTDTFASQLLLNGESIPVVKELMGHKNATTTLRVYAHFIPKSDTGAASRYAEAVFALWTPDGHQGAAETHIAV
jgi:integrase